jgi:signal transduction histidine kinase
MLEGDFWHYAGGSLARAAAVGLLLAVLLAIRGRLGPDAKFGPIIWGVFAVLAASLAEAAALLLPLPGWSFWVAALLYAGGLFLVARGILHWAVWVSALKAKSAERDALLEESHRLGALLAESHRVAQLGFLVADRGLRRIRWHGVGLPHINTQSADSSIDTVLRDMVQPEDRPALEQALRRLHRDGQAAFDLALRGRDGSYRWYRIAAHLDPKQPAESDHAVFAVLQDIDAAKRSQLAHAEALRVAEAASGAKTTFLATMSHELRTPLNAILGFSEIIMHQMAGNAPPRYVDYARQIHKAGSDLLEIIDRVLEVVRIDSGRRQLVPELLAPQQEIESVAAGFAAAAARHGIALAVACDEALGAQRLDAAILRDVLGQVIGNAIKFNTDGGRVDIRVHDLGPGLRIAVSDTGIGIQPDHLGRVFDLFWQSEGSLARQHGGTGLGLAIARRLCALHHGGITVDSTPNLGTTVTIDLRPAPAAPATAEAAA